MTAPTKRKMTIFQDEIKLRHTTHWDVDTMSRSEYEAYMQGELDPPSQNIYQLAQTAAAATPTAPDIEHQPLPPARDDRAAGGDSLWDRFMRACLPRS